MRIALWIATLAAVVLVFGLVSHGLVWLGLLPHDLLDAGDRVLGLVAVVGLVGSLGSLLSSKPLATWSTRARVIDRPRNDTERWLVDAAGELAARAGIRTPELAIYDAVDPNAFTVGWHRDRSLLAVSTGLLRTLDARQTRAVLAHEISHVASGDMVTRGLLEGVLHTFVRLPARIVATLFDRRRRGREREGGAHWLTTVLAQLCFGLLATPLVRLYCRRREHRADAGAARLVGAKPMIDALARLRGVAWSSALPQGLRCAGIRDRSSVGVLAFHPPLFRRIQRLARLESAPRLRSGSRARSGSP